MNTKNQSYTFQPRKAVRQNLKARIGLLGPAGSGKTYTALAVASGLGQRVCIIDTERGSSERYADLFSFDVVELPHYSPEMYAQAIEQLSASGNYDVLVVDSLSHAWNGTGGALELVDEAASKGYGNNKWAGWRDVTPMHNRMVDAMLQAQCHVIVTMRVKMTYEQVEENGKKSIKKLGLAPIQRDGLEYEFDLVLDIDIDHKASVAKCRYATLNLSEGKRLDGAVVHKPGPEFGRILASWLDQGEDVETRNLRLAREEEKRRTRELQAQMEKRVARARKTRDGAVKAGVWPAWADDMWERALDLALAYPDDDRPAPLIRAMISEAQAAHTESRRVDPVAFLPAEAYQAVANFGAEADDQIGWPELDARVWLEIIAEHSAGVTAAHAAASGGSSNAVAAEEAKSAGQQASERVRTATASMSAGDLADLIDAVVTIKAFDRWSYIRTHIRGEDEGVREPGADDDLF